MKLQHMSKYATLWSKSTEVSLQHILRHCVAAVQVYSQPGVCSSVQEVVRQGCQSLDFLLGLGVNEIIYIYIYI